jgi:hypothetical protein
MASTVYKANQRSRVLLERSTGSVFKNAVHGA